MILSDSTRSVTLPDNLEWVEELNWSYKVVRQERGVTGKVVRTVSTRVGGKPITLQPSDKSMSWVLRSSIETLQAMVEADEEMTLAFSESEELTVVFRHEPNALEAKPVKGFTNRDGNEWWQVTIKLSTVAA